MWKALMDSEDALSAFTEWGPCHFRFGEVLVIAGDFQGALRCFQRAVAFSPSQKDYKASTFPGGLGRPVPCCCAQQRRACGQPE